MENNRIEEVIDSSIEKIKKIVDTNTIIGEEIMIDGKKLIPISKITIGFVSGGGEYKSSDKQVAKTKTYPMAGGVGSGISVTPIAFLVVESNSVKLIKVDNFAPLEKFFDVIPKVTSSITDAIKKQKEKKIK